MALASTGLIVGKTIKSESTEPEQKIIQEVDNAAAVRVAFITDMHVTPNYPNSLKVLDDTIAGLNQRASSLDIVINGGDTVYDILYEPKDKSEMQWAAVTEAFEKCTLPIYHTIGNHDIWGWGLDKINPSEPGYGKQMPLDKLNMQNPYYSFTKENWKYIILDNCQKKELGYKIGLDKPQISWLANELSTAKEDNICIVSHAPLLSACYQMFTVFSEDGKRVILDDELLVNKDFDSIDALIHHPKVKICLSGHLHMKEDLRYKNTRYISFNALSGAKWEGDFMGFAKAYALIDFYNDGTFDYRLEYV